MINLSEQIGTMFALSKNIMKKLTEIIAILALLIGSSTPLFAQEKGDDSLTEIFKKLSESRQVILLSSAHDKATLDLHLDNPKIQLTIRF